ncbi:MAG: DUF1080 domain-containing protein [Opitutaceae bacterium]|jgi:hypothetical protein|nr:DUF1080 domain-containing protein [Opitutaceae bacterium]
MKKIPLAAFAFTAACGTSLLAERVPPSGYVAEENVSQTWSGKPAAKAERWPAPQPLFAKDLSNAGMRPGSWEYKDGVLASKGNGYIWTKEAYGDFVLNLDFRVEEKTDTGVILRCTSNTRDWVQNSIEVQIIPGERPNDKHNAGGIYDIAAPSRAVEIVPGKWHHYTITAQGSKIQVVFDGERVTAIDLSEWKKAGQNPDGTKNKFKKAMAEAAREGSIGLQAHKTAAFRNIVIEPVNLETPKK